MEVGVLGKCIWKTPRHLKTIAVHKSASFFKICVFLGHIFKKFRADHIGFFSHLFEMY